MIDFDALVLKPAMNTFARPITVFPLASQPGAPAYPARAVWRLERNVDLALEDGGVLSSDVLTLGARLSEFVVPPQAGDQVDVPLSGAMPALGLYYIDDTDDDGEGGTKWTLKQVSA